MGSDPEKITYFAKTDARGAEVPFGIKMKDRQRHMYVIGKTGMGKSTMLENMAIQDIKSGEGIAFIDPHGSTADKLLAYVPEDRVKDVLYFAPFDMDYPVSFNVMEDVGPDKRHLVVSGLMSTFKKIWVDAWSARMEYILSNTLLALLEYPNSTLLGVNRMLSDKQYREAVVENIKDPSVRSFWVDEFAKYNERYMQEAGDAIKNKIGQFTANPLIRNIIGQPHSSFDVRKIMDEKKILIMNLSKGLVGETNANLLGSMLITRIYLSAMSRADLSAQSMSAMPNFYFYVDEFQSFANETFANILSEARKYKLNLIIAHQYIEQMEEEVRNAVFGNVGTIVSFRVGPFDAEILETIFTPQFLATDICNLGFAQVYLTLMIDGIGSKPFSAVTLSPIEQAQFSSKDQIIASSREAFAHARDEVENAITAWHAPIERSTARKPIPRKEPPRAPYVDKKSPEKQNEKNTSRAPVRDTMPVPNKDDKTAHTKKGERIARPTERIRPSPPQKSLEDLRSVLKSMSTQEVSGTKASHGVRNTASEQKKETDGDLKSILEGLVNDSAKPAHKKEAHDEHTVQKSAEESVSKKQIPSKHENKNKKKNSPHTDAQLAHTHESELTAKQLEKMLRVSQHERPPIKSF